MAPRSRPTPSNERRARRIRAAVWSSFAALLVLVLLGFAAYGAMITRRVPPLHAVPRIEASGVMEFDVTRILAHVSQGDLLLDTPGSEFFSAELRAFRSFLGPQGQLFLWRPESDQPDLRWALHLPIVRPQAVNLRRFRAALANSNVLAEIGSPLPAGPPPIAWFEVRPQGILLLSSADSPGFDFMPVPAEVEPFEARYISSDAWQPAFLRELVPVNSALRGSCPAPVSLEVVWAGGQHRGEVLYVFRCDGEPRAEIHPYIFPFAGLFSTTAPAP